MARIGTVGYLNARPLTDRVDIDRHTLVLAHPSRVARMLVDGDVDVALAPVAAVLSDGDFRIAPGWCIGAEGAVASVLLVAETPPEAWTEVVLDGASRTSAVLARLLLAGPLAPRLRPDLEIARRPPGTASEEARGTTAALVIGDAARVLPERLSVRLDLARLWHEWTGLPFVFAVWAGRPDVDPATLRHLAEAGADGVAAISTTYSGADRAYLETSLRYPLDDRALCGLRRFAALGHAAGLLGTADVVLYGPGATTRPRTAPVDGLLERAAAGAALDHAELLRIADHAPTPDLLVAADVLRARLHPDGTAAYGVALEIAEDPAPETLMQAAQACSIHLHAPTPARVRTVRAASTSRIAARAHPDALEELCRAGLDALADDPAGSVDDAVRTTVPGAGTWAEHTAMLRAAAALGMGTVATVRVGDAVATEQLVATLLALRALHDELGLLEAVRVLPGSSLRPSTEELLRATALTRLALPGVPSLRATPEPGDLGRAQLALGSGCDHLGVFASTAPSAWAAWRADAERHVRAAGLAPLSMPAGRRGPGAAHTTEAQV